MQKAPAAKKKTYARRGGARPSLWISHVFRYHSSSSAKDRDGEVFFDHESQ